MGFSAASGCVREEGSAAAILRLAYFAMTKSSPEAAKSGLEGAPVLMSADMRFVSAGQGLVAVETACLSEGRLGAGIDEAATLTEGLVRHVRMTFASLALRFTKVGRRLTSASHMRDCLALRSEDAWG